MDEQKSPDLSEFIIDGPPWEKKHELGFFVAFLETIKAFLLRPAHAFSVMRRVSPIGDALVYAVAIQVFTFLWMMTFQAPDPNQLFEQFPELQTMFELPENFGQIMVLVYPISVIVLQFMAALSFHLALKWRDQQPYDFSLVFRITAYASGTAALLTILPIFGGLLSLGMTIYLGWVGFRTIYGLDGANFSVTALLATGIIIVLYIGLSILITILLIIVAFLFFP